MKRWPRPSPGTPRRSRRREPFAVVLEGTVEPQARAIATDLGTPVIGTGASPAAQGQILVSEDILGLYGEFTPKFVKRYADLGAAAWD